MSNTKKTCIFEKRRIWLYKQFKYQNGDFKGHKNKYLQIDWRRTNDYSRYFELENSQAYRAAYNLYKDADVSCVSGGCVQRALFKREYNGDIDMFTLDNGVAQNLKQHPNYTYYNSSKYIDEFYFKDEKITDKKLQIINHGDLKVENKENVFDFSICEMALYATGHKTKIIASKSAIDTLLTGKIKIQWDYISDSLIDRYYKYKMQGWKFLRDDEARIKEIEADPTKLNEYGWKNPLWTIYMNKQSLL